MDTALIEIQGHAPDADAVRRAADVLKQGGLVAFPTETVYGLAARADHADAVAQLRHLKSRGADKAFTVHISSPADAGRFAPRIEGLAARLIRKGWPGPLTLILPVDDPGSAPVMAGLNGSVAGTMYHEGTVGLRCPDDPVAANLLRLAGGPVVASSANRAGQPPPWTGADVMSALGGEIDLLLDCGRTRYAKPSTIVRVEGPSYRIVREGVLDAGILERLSVLSLLFVCTGNTCRSPMAAALAARMLAERLGCGPKELMARGVDVRSAGTSGGVGRASPAAVEVMARRGLDLSDHVSMALRPELVYQADYVFVMTRAHLEAIRDLQPSAADRTKLLLGDEEVQDPHGGSDGDYERCARMIEAGLAARLQEVIV